MAQNYRIYINEKVVIISQTAPENTENAEQLGVQQFDFAKIYFDVLNSRQQTFFVIANEPKAFLKQITKSISLIEAAGGLVKNKKGQYLFIYRNNRWDLPKGKLEKSEKARAGAVREVEEECGIEIDKSGKKICKTYHAYTIKGQVVLKKTHWYKMKFTGKGKLTPQIEEGITDVKWFERTNLGVILDNTFPSITEVLQEVHLIKGNQEQPLG